MEARYKKTIDNLKSWKAISTFEKNARDRGRLSDELSSALKERSTALGRTLLHEKTGIDLTNLSAVETEIVHVVSEYFGIQKRKGKGIEYTLRQIQNHGLKGAAESAVTRATPTKGFENLKEEGLGD